MRKSSFGAVADARTRVLVLGSLPGEESLRRGQYYAHPRNQFWRLIGAVTQADLAARPYPERLEALQAAGVGLWDVVRSAARKGSLDTHIRDHEPNTLEALTAELPQLRAVAFNGGTALRLGRSLLDGVAGVEIVALPSSSPAHTLAYDLKLQAWMELRPLLDR
jgi:TDG/mug DNA glycosylase family protein